ncbi:hypothetical protein HK102_010643 [Quaeritorhiza haematococci]|nr:hypothetical protein HK102_010643 [Quaeritorhiza haematococci]
MSGDSNTRKDSVRDSFGKAHKGDGFLLSRGLTKRLSRLGRIVTSQNAHQRSLERSPSPAVLNGSPGEHVHVSAPMEFGSFELRPRAGLKTFVTGYLGMSPCAVEGSISLHLDVQTIRCSGVFVEVKATIAVPNKSVGEQIASLYDAEVQQGIPSPTLTVSKPLEFLPTTSDSPTSDSSPSSRLQAHQDEYATALHRTNTHSSYVNGAPPLVLTLSRSSTTSTRRTTFSTFSRHTPVSSTSLPLSLGRQGATTSEPFEQVFFSSTAVLWKPPSTVVVKNPDVDEGQSNGQAAGEGLCEGSVIPLGNHVFPFCISLPPELPGTTSYGGRVRYLLRAWVQPASTFVRPWSCETTLEIPSCRDLPTQFPQGQPPSLYKSPWCSTAYDLQNEKGRLNVDTKAPYLYYAVKLPFSTYGFGEDIELEVDVRCGVGVTVKRVVGSLMQSVEERIPTSDQIDEVRDDDTSLDTSFAFKSGEDVENAEKVLPSPPPESDITLHVPSLSRKSTMASTLSKTFGTLRKKSRHARTDETESVVNVGDCQTDAGRVWVPISVNFHYPATKAKPTSPPSDLDGTMKMALRLPIEAGLGAFSMSSSTQPPSDMRNGSTTFSGQAVPIASCESSFISVRHCLKVQIFTRGLPVETSTVIEPILSQPGFTLSGSPTSAAAAVRHHRTNNQIEITIPITLVPINHALEKFLLSIRDSNKLLPASSSLRAPSRKDSLIASDSSKTYLMRKSFEIRKQHRRRNNGGLVSSDSHHLDENGLAHQSHHRSKSLKEGIPGGSVRASGSDVGDAMASIGQRPHPHTLPRLFRVSTTAGAVVGVDFVRGGGELKMEASEANDEKKEIVQAQMVAAAAELASRRRGSASGDDEEGGKRRLRLKGDLILIGNLITVEKARIGSVSDMYTQDIDHMAEYLQQPPKSFNPAHFG